MSSKNSTKKVLPIGRKLTEADIAALEKRLAEAERALEAERAAKAALEAKVKTSAKREAKAPDSYNVLQPIFVAIRGNVNRNIVDNDVLLNIFQYSVHTLKITLDDNIQKRLFERTVLHNSCANIAKAETLASAEGRRGAYLEMLDQCKVMLPAITEAEWVAYKKEYDAAYQKAVEKLKK